MKLEYRKIEEKDKDQLFCLINIVLKGLENPEYFIPYEQWELDSMFDEINYAPLYGAYDGDKLVGMAQLYVSQDMLKDFKEELSAVKWITIDELIDKIKNHSEEFLIKEDRLPILEKMKSLMEEE